MQDSRLFAAILAMAVLAAASCTHPSKPQAPSTQTTPSPRPSPEFQAVDTNGNGQIDRAEFHRHAMEEFSTLDRDKDGYLTKSELPQVPAEVFRAADADSDGRLSAIEYMNQRLKEFSDADRNRDGVLTQMELDGSAGFVLLRWR